MDFFREQDIARRNTRLLLVLFSLAVLVLVLLTNALLTGALFLGENPQVLSEGPPATVLQQIDWGLVAGVSGGVIAVIGIVVLVNWIRFAQGGSTVAEALGGRPAATSSDDPLERRALNIVAEMALAANMPVPPLYILDEERGINAFAAGLSPADAVVAITRGAMVQLNRDELQGVIGHEFSHILNGDMRLSIRLAAMLRGITFIGDVGALLLRGAAYSRPRRRADGKGDGRAVAMMIGLGLYVIGLLGGVMAGIIKSAISKQKEYLADASAVQFTRNPDGIASALKVIGGYTPGTLVHTARAEELSHLFFGQVKHRLWLLFATHPPLPKRIRRIDPQWDGQFIARTPDHANLEPGRFAEAGQDRARRMLNAATALTPVHLTLDAVGEDAADTATNLVDANSAPTHDDNAIAAALIEQSREPLSAMALVLALLWRPGAQEDQQYTALQGAQIKGLADLTVQFGRELVDLPRPLRLPLLELCLPTLKQISTPQFETLRRLMLALIKADGEIALEEWCLYQLVRHYLDPAFQRVAPSTPRHKTLSSVADAVTVVLGTVAMQCDADPKTAFDRGIAILELPLRLPNVDALGVPQFSSAVKTLADCYPLPKVGLLKALAAAAAHDDWVNPEELMLIRAIAAMIDCPVPDHMLPGVTTDASALR